MFDLPDGPTTRILGLDGEAWAREWLICQDRAASEARRHPSVGEWFQAAIDAAYAEGLAKSEGELQSSWNDGYAEGYDVGYDDGWTRDD